MFSDSLPRHKPKSIERRFLKPLRKILNLGFFRFKVRGTEHIPKTGPVIFVANHSGWIPLDALFLLLAINDSVGPRHLPYLIVHDMLIKLPITYRFLKNLGLIPADWLHYGRETLPADLNPIAIFPEGADGNCKPFWQAYHMRHWKTGFVRLAIQRGAKVVPVAIIGGEEAMPVAATVNILKPLLGSVAPLPVSLAPLPSYWKIYFMEPVDFSVYPKELHADREACERIAQEVHQLVQARLQNKSWKNPLNWLGNLLDS
jgi:1-acyl-sn-glycerol-3-phosphate acyltransferase